MGRILDRFTGNISPIALLVSSFFWSWLDIVTFSPAFFLTAGKPVDVVPFAAAFAASTFLLAAFVANSKLRELMLGARSFVFCSLLFGSLGSLLVWIGLHVAPVLVIVGGVLTGLYLSVGVVVCGGLATCQGTTNAFIHLAAALPLNIVAIVLMVLLRPGASIGFAVLLPLLSALCYVVYLAHGKNRETINSIAITHEERSDARFPGRRVLGCDPYFLLMVLSICVAFGFVNYQTMFLGSMRGASFNYSEVIVRALTSLAILVGYLRYSWRPYSILRLALILMSVGLIASGIVLVLGLSGSALFNALTLTGYACFDLLIWAIIIMVSYRSGSSLLGIICVVHTVDQFGILAGTLLGVLACGEGASIVSYVALGSVLLFVTLGFSSGKNIVRDNLSACEIEFDKVGEPAGAENAGLAASCGYQDRVASVAEEFFLTSRETDVLSLLVSGRNGPYIAEHLHVSENTVKSHIRHMYTKMDVHNRQELLDVIFPPSA